MAVIGDFIDKLNYRCTPIVCFIVAICVCWRLSSPDAVQCWTPAVFTSGMQEYAEATCRHELSVFSAKNDFAQRGLDPKPTPRALQDWVSVFVALQGFLALVPLGVWYCIKAWNSGIDVDQIVSMASFDSGINKIMPFKHIPQDFSKIGRVLHRYLLNSSTSAMLAMAYVFVKILAHATSLFQLSLMSNYLQFNNSRFGYEILKNISHGLEYDQSPSLPEVFLCDYEVRMLGNVHRYTLQCSAPGNKSVQKVFVFLWVWFAIMAALNLASALWWSGATLLNLGRRRFLNKFDAKFPRTFGARFFGADAAFCLRMVDQIAGSLATSQIVDQLSLAHSEYLSSLSAPRVTSPETRRAPSNSDRRWNPLNNQNGLEDSGNDLESQKYGKKPPNRFGENKPETYPMNYFDSAEQVNNNKTQNNNVYPSAPVQDDENDY